MANPMVGEDMPKFLCEAWLEEEPEESPRFACGLSRQVYAWPGACSIVKTIMPSFFSYHISATTEWLERARRLGDYLVYANLGKWPTEVIGRHEIVSPKTIERTFGRDVAKQFNVAKVYW